MTHVITAEELGRRLRTARETCGLTQDDVAAELGVSRSAVAQIEAGKRGVGGIELAKLAFLFGRDMRELVELEFHEADPLAALFRSNEDVSSDRVVRQRLRDCIALGREITNLEHLLGFDREVAFSASYSIPDPTSKWDAIEQGARIADEERRRLGLGHGPAPEMSELLETQGIRAARLSLPDDVSGLTLSDARIGLFVVVNDTHADVRQRFSYAHEYAHALVDRKRFGLVSRDSRRDDLVEVRANSFAAAFLLPAEGLRQFLANVGKGKPTRTQLDIFFGGRDGRGEDVASIEARTDPHAQQIQLYDVVQLAHHFQVSAPTALYRLKNLRIINQGELDALRPAVDAKANQVRKLLRLPDFPSEAASFQRRFLSLGLEALRRGYVSRAKVVELGKMVDISKPEIEQLIRQNALDEAGGVDAIVPDDE